MSLLYTLLYLKIRCFVSRVMFIVKLAIFLLLLILSYTVFPVLFTRYCYSALDCTIPMNRSLIRYGCINLGRTSIDGNLRFLQFPWAVFCSLGKFSSSKMLVSLTQYRGTVGIFSKWLFVRALKYNNFSLVPKSFPRSLFFRLHFSL